MEKNVKAISFAVKMDNALTIVLESDVQLDIPVKKVNVLKIQVQIADLLNVQTALNV